MNDLEVSLIITRINKLLKEKNITAYKVSITGKFNPRTLNHILNGTYNDIKLSTINKICLGFNISLKEFFNDEIFN